MIPDIIKLLLEEPTKLKKLIIILFRMALSIILASWLYTHLISDYTLINILSSKEWAEFILSGRILIVGIMYLTGHFILFQLLEGLLTFPAMRLMTPKPPKNIDRAAVKIIAFLLRLFKLLDLNLETKKAQLMEHSEAFYEVVNEFTKKETRNEVRQFQNSFISEIFYTYLAFLLLYVCDIIPKFPHTSGFNILLIVGLLFILSAYVGLGVLIELMYKMSPGLIKLMNVIKLQDFLDTQFKENYIYLYNPENKYDEHKLFFFNNKEVAVLIAGEINKITPRMVEMEVKYAIDHNRCIWLISNKPIQQEAQALIEKNGDKLEIVSFSSREELAMKIKERLVMLASTR